MYENIRRFGASKCRQRLSTTTDVCVALLWRCTVSNQGVSGQIFLNLTPSTIPEIFFGIILFHPLYVRDH